MLINMTGADQITMMKLNKLSQFLVVIYLIKQCIGKDGFVRGKRLNMKCPRRFSPGVCAEPVSPVWTFDFFKQNCTERLGCIKVTRSNRFSSYEICLRSCRAFIDIYTQSLSEYNGELQRLRSELDDTGRRIEQLQASFYEEQVNAEEQETDSWSGPAEDVEIADFKLLNNEGVIAPDIDYSGFEAEECDLVHHARDPRLKQ